MEDKIIEAPHPVIFPVIEPTDMELPAIERGLLRLWHNGQIKTAGNYILEYGCCESPCAQTLAISNHVIGVDIRPYYIDPKTKEPVVPNFKFIQADASKISITTEPKFDLAIAVSSIEHFGLSEYGGEKDEYADVKAMWGIWNSLKVGGIAMVTLPITSGNYEEFLGYIRRYTKKDLLERIVQGNIVQRFEILTHHSGPDFVGGEKAFYKYDFSDLVGNTDIYLEMVKGGINEPEIRVSETVR